MAKLGRGTPGVAIIASGGGRRELEVSGVLRRVHSHSCLRTSQLDPIPGRRPHSSDGRVLWLCKLLAFFCFCLHQADIICGRDEG